MGGTISIGMDAETVLVSWGQPNDINKLIIPQGTSEQWIYGSGIKNRNYVHLTNGVVTSMADF